MDGHKKRQKENTNAFIVKEKKTKRDHPKAWMVLQIYMGAHPCTSKVKNDTKQNDKEQNDKAFEAKKEKKTSGVTLWLVHDYNINGNTTFTLHTSRIKKDRDPIISHP